MTILNSFSHSIRFLPLIGLAAFYFDSSFVDLRMFFPRLDPSSLNTIYLVGTAGCIVAIIGLLYIIHNNLKNKVLGNLYLFNVLVTLSQLIIICMLLVTYFEYIVNGSYEFTNVAILLILSYGLSLFFMGLSAFRYFEWYNYERKAVILGYALASSVIIIFLLSSIAYAAYELYTQNRIYVNSLDLTLQVSGKNQSPNIFGTLYYYTYIFTFLSVWVVTLLFLKSRIRNTRPFLFLTILIIPLVYFLLPLVPQFSNLLARLIVQSPHFYGTFYLIFFSGTGPIGGVIFAIALLLLARRFSDNLVKKYLSISAIGMLFFFIVNQDPPLAEDLNPPFGLISKSFVGLSCYMIFIGFYSIVVYLTRKDRLTKAVLVEVSKDDLFGSLLRSEQEKQIQSIVNRSMMIIQENQQIETKDLSAEEINDLIALVKNEISTRKLDEK